jgi:predicted protein tyrosine phosphatase
MKVLTVCIGGMVRSAGIADVLRNDKGIDSIALSAINNTPETMDMICEWADLIIPVEPQYKHKVPEQYRIKWESCKMWDAKYDHKRKVFDLGPDVWGNARDPILRKKIVEQIDNFL